MTTTFYFRVEIFKYAKATKKKKTMFNLNKKKVSWTLFIKINKLLKVSFLYLSYEYI